jgi:hypothetical protein
MFKTHEIMVPKPKSPTWKKVYKIIRIAAVHFKTKPGINSLRNSPTRNNVLHYSAATRVFQMPHKQLMHIFFALLQFCMVLLPAWTAK